MIFSHKNQHTWLIILSKMAANISSFLNKIASLGLGVAVVGGVVNTALYNGEWYTTARLFDSKNLNFDLISGIHNFQVPTYMHTIHLCIL